MYLSHFFALFILAGFLTVLPDQIPIVFLTFANLIACYMLLCTADVYLATVAFRVAATSWTYTKL